MDIQIKSGTVVKGRTVGPGDVVTDVAERDARLLIALGKAVPYVAPKPKAKARKYVES